jgi:hypothetical protein
MAMIAMTTRSSMRVKPLCRAFFKTHSGFQLILSDFTRVGSAIRAGRRVGLSGKVVAVVGQNPARIARKIGNEYINA